MYLHDWKDGGKALMLADFCIEAEDIEGANVLLASYSFREKDETRGEAFVLFEKDGNLYEVNGCHCSCDDLKDQWEPEETTKSGLLHRIIHGNLGTTYDKNIFANELREVLEKL